MTEEAQEPQVSNNEPNEQETNTPDLSAYFKDGEAGVFDPEKVAGLAKDLENQKKSTSYFQSQFMKKNGVPETAEGYYTHFKADSTYEEALKDETIKNNVDDFFKWCKDTIIFSLSFRAKRRISKASTFYVLEIFRRYAPLNDKYRVSFSKNPFKTLKIC